MRTFILRIALTVALSAPASASAYDNNTPNLLETYQKALVTHGLAPTQHYYLLRARLSHLIPRIQIRQTHDNTSQNQIDYREDQLLQPNGLLRRDFARHNVDNKHQQRTGLTIQYTWNLSHLVFDPREITIERHLQQTQRLRNDLQKRLVKVYTRRKKNLLTLTLLPQTQTLQRERLKLEVLLDTQQLDLWTNGWFSQHLHTPKKRP